MIGFNDKLLNNKDLKESCIKQDKAGLTDYPVDKKSVVGVQSFDKKEIASGYPVPEYNTSVCDDINKKTEKMQDVHCAVNASTGLKSASSGQQKQSFNSLVYCNPVQKQSLQDLIKTGNPGDHFLCKKRIKKSKNKNLNFIYGVVKCY